MNETKKIKPWRGFEPEEIEAARELYSKHGPANLSRIVRDMRDAGWRQFVLSDLTGRHGRGFPGLDRVHGWSDEWLRRAEAEAAAATTETAQPDSQDSLDSPDQPDSPDSPPKPPVDFPSWLEGTRSDWKWRENFQTHVYRELEKVTAGRVTRLMIFMPPRHGKSELVTIRYAAWRLSLDPGLRIVVSSYNQRLANLFSRRIKAVYQGAPRIELSENCDERDLVLNAMDEWETAAGGGVKAVGAGAGITGFGADLIIIDDPVKSRAEAESKNQRTRVWEWFNDDLTTRLEPRGAIILIQTRWHEDDLAGRLLARVENGLAEGKGKKSKVKIGAGQIESGKLKIENGKHEAQSSKSKGPGQKSKLKNRRSKIKNRQGEWNVVSLPALAEENDPIKRKPGQALCHARFSRRKLLKKKAEMGSYSFAALYQQSPVPGEGALFKRDWFSRFCVAAPAGLKWCRGYDLAVSTKTSADYTASFRCAVDKATGDLYIADGMRGRLEFPDQRKYIVGRIREEPDTEHGIEEALHGQAFVQELWRDARLSRFIFRGVRVTADKFTRALAWANRAEAGKVVLVRGPWNDEFLDEVCHFPNAAHDDQVDAISLAVQMMDTQKKKAYGF